jgi:hypothetical protein
MFTNGFADSSPTLASRLLSIPSDRKRGALHAARARREGHMEVAAVFIAFLTPLCALVAGVALVTFSSLKSACPIRKLMSSALFIGVISALGWAPALLSSSVGLWIYLGVVAASALGGSVLILFVTAESVTTVDRKDFRQRLRMPNSMATGQAL